MAEHRGSSHVQQQAEAVVRELLSARLGVTLTPETLPLEGGASVRVDAVAADQSVFAEIFARQGKLKPGQQKKVAIDAFKLVTLQRRHPDSRLMIVFCDDAAAAYAQGGGWLARALDAWSIDVVVINIDQELRDEIVAAQKDQMMVSPTADEDEATAELD